jgi:fatty acid desaturase
VDTATDGARWQKRLSRRVSRPDDVSFLELAERLREAGIFEPSDGIYRRRLTLLLPLFAVAYAALIVFPGGIVWGLFVCVAAVAAVQLGIVAHDAGHRAVDARRWVNDVWGHVGMTLLTGLSFTHWRMQHNQHHRHCQDEDRDPDVQYRYFLALHPRSAGSRSGLARRLLPLQPYYFWILAALAYPWALRLASLRTLISRPGATRVDRAVLPFHYLLWLGAPALFVGPRAATVTYAATSLVVGVLLTGLFSGNHMGMPTLGPGEPASYLRRQVETSRNIDVPAPLRFLFGGLDYQIEHHLFPFVAQPRLPAARRVVEPFCRAHGVAYHSEGFFTAQRAIHRHLARIGALGRAEPEVQRSAAHVRWTDLSSPGDG